MIDPTDQDVGRKVAYRSMLNPAGKPEEGVITSFNGSYVFVRYGTDAHSKATDRRDLIWMRPALSSQDRGAT